MAFSSLGKRKLGVHVLLIVFTILALVFAVRVNNFQEYYFIADLFPLGLAVATLAILVLTFVLDIAIQNTPTARPAVEVCILYVLSIVWLAFNVFSTSRWSQIPMNCNSIPDEYADMRVWCRDVQVLKSFVWIDFAAIFVTASWILGYTLSEHKHGRNEVWSAPLSRYDPRRARNRSVRTTITDYFAPSYSGHTAFEKF